MGQVARALYIFNFKMKKFLLHIILFFLIFFLSAYLIALQADGYSDSFYLKFTTPKQTSLILGNSKAAQGLKPEVFTHKLKKNIYNYSFAINTSPFGPKYLKSIQSKLDTTNDNGLFIISIDSWSLSTNCDNPNDTVCFREIILILIILNLLIEIQISNIF